MNRPIVVAIIGYIIGIIWGLYFKINIALFYFLIIAIIIFFYKKPKSKQIKKFKQISFYRYFRYIKLIFKSHVIFLIIIISIISNLLIKIQEKNYNLTYNINGTFNFIGIVQSGKEEKEYYDRYIVKIINADNNKILKNKKIYLKIKDKKQQELECGDLIEFKGEYLSPNIQRNYKGFDERKYLKTKKICGTVETDNVYINKKKQGNIFLRSSQNFATKIKENIEKTFDNETGNILKGLLLGDTSELEENMKEDFRTANMAHILAVSGMHINYIILGITLLLDKKVGKKKLKIILIIFLFFYMYMVGLTPSVVRSCVMGILMLFSSLVYRKNDTFTAIGLSMFVNLSYNQYLILNEGFQLSYLGTVGIIYFNPIILKILNNKDNKNISKKMLKLLDKIKEIVSVSVSAQIMIIPILLYKFNFFNPYSIISNFLVSIIIGPIIILRFYICNHFFVFM